MWDAGPDKVNMTDFSKIEPHSEFDLSLPVRARRHQKGSELIGSRISEEIYEFRPKAEYGHVEDVSKLYCRP